MRNFTWWPETEDRPCTYMVYRAIERAELKGRRGGGGGERRLNGEGRLRKPNCRRNDRRIKGGGGEISLRVTDGQQWKPVFWAKTKESYTRGRET